MSNSEAWVATDVLSTASGCLGEVSVIVVETHDVSF